MLPFVKVVHEPNPVNEEDQGINRNQDQRQLLAGQLEVCHSQYEIEIKARKLPS